jgi:hypothetical protein
MNVLQVADAINNKCAITDVTTLILMNKFKRELFNHVITDRTLNNINVH